MTITTTDYEKREIGNHLDALGAKTVLEIGAFRGETTRVILDSLIQRDGHVVVIDPMQWSSEVLRNGIGRHMTRTFPRLLSVVETALRQLSYEHAFWRNVGHHESQLTLHRALSTDRELVRNTDVELANFDAVFIDGDHSYEGAMADLDNWGTRVREGGLILVHDVTSRFPGVMRAVLDWTYRRPVDVTWPTQDSLCVLKVRADLRAAKQKPSPTYQPQRSPALCAAE